MLSCDGWADTLYGVTDTVDDTIIAGELLGSES